MDSDKPQETSNDSKAEQNKDQKPKKKPLTPQQKRKRILLAVVVALIALFIGFLYYLHARKYENTDDAFIEAHVIQLSPQVSAHVWRIYIDDNYEVAKGDLLIELDPRDYQVSVKEAQANFEKAKSDFERVERLKSTGAVSKQDIDSAQANLDVTKARLEQAQLNLSYTKIEAPEPGKITRKNVEIGDYVQPGQALLAIVPHDVWVIANYRETQLTHMKVGQHVEIYVDAYPKYTFKGHVDSIQSGSGARFSLLPPENATGNYVKVVQRIPVKIVFDEPLDKLKLLSPGMSVEPTVKVR